MDGALTSEPLPEDQAACLDRALDELDAAKDGWSRTPVSERRDLLRAVISRIGVVAENWAELSARKKGLDPTSSLAGEEWIIGPYATLSAADALCRTFARMEGKRFLDGLARRSLPDGRLALTVFPARGLDRLLLSGVTAEVWMQPSVSSDTLKDHAAIAYDTPETDRQGKVTLILGAGNVSSIPVLDVFQKLFIENQVAILKMNPVNDYLTDIFKDALAPLISEGALRIVTGGRSAGEYLAVHPLISELHVTGSDATHDAIVWGTGTEGVKNRKADTPRNTRRFTSELGSVSPVIVVPGPWSAADIRYQAESIATMKLHNSGHNCIAAQALILPKNWPGAPKLLTEVTRVARAHSRPLWYPDAAERMESYESFATALRRVPRGNNKAPDMLLDELGKDAPNARHEVFGPAMGVRELAAPDAETFLAQAIAYANDELWGTLGANVLIHPKTIARIGKKHLDELLAELRYGTIAINCWSGLAFSLPNCPWGAYPGHDARDIQSGTGIVHNAFMLENTEKVVLRAPWRPFPRSLLSGDTHIMPRPPYFITNRRQRQIGSLLTGFQTRPSAATLARLLVNALRG